MSSDSIKNIVGNIVYLAAQWMMAIVVVWFSNYQDAGYLSIAMTLCNIFYIISNYNFRSFQISDIHDQYEDNSYILARLVTISIGMFISIVITFLTSYTLTQKIVIFTFMLYKSCESLSEMSYGFFQKMDNYNFLCSSMCIKGIVSIVVFSLVLYCSENLALSLSIMSFCLILVVIFYDFPRLRTRIPYIFRFNETNFTQAKQLLVQCFPLMLIMISLPVMLAIPRIIFEKNFSTELFGIYSSLSTPSIILNVFITCAFAPFIPQCTAWYEEGNGRRMFKFLIKFILFTIMLGILGVIATYFFGSSLFPLIFGSAVLPYLNVFYAVIFSIITMAIVQCLSNVLILMRKFTILTIVSLLSCVICLLASPFLITKWGMYGIPLVLVFTQTLQAFILFFTVYQNIQKYQPI